jgi:hypothetical protein
MWGEDLNDLGGFSQMASRYLEAIEAKGMREAMKALVG